MELTPEEKAIQLINNPLPINVSVDGNLPNTSHLIMLPREIISNGFIDKEDLIRIMVFNSFYLENTPKKLRATFEFWIKVTQILEKKL